MNCSSRQTACLIAFRDSFESSTVDVIVGEAETKFVVYKAVLSNIAPFFKAALEGNFKESSEQKITLPEESPEVFRRFLLWAHSGSLLGHQEHVTDLSPEILIRLYIFGDAHGVPDLQNAAVDSLGMWSNYKKLSPVSILHLAFRDTRRGCTLQRFLVDWAASRGSLREDWFVEEKLVLYPTVYLAELVMVLYDVKEGTASPIKDNEWAKPGCRYHIHPEAN